MVANLKHNVIIPKTGGARDNEDHYNPGDEMFYVIVLDRYQTAANDYEVTFSGSLDECRQQTNHAGAQAAWPKSDYVEVTREAKSLLNTTGTPDSGFILTLDNAGGSVGMINTATRKAKPRKRKVAKPRSQTPTSQKGETK